MKQIDLPIYIEVENGTVIAVWVDFGDGLDRMLNVGSEYYVSYRTVPEAVKQHRKEHEHEEPINWLEPKLYKPEQEGDEE